MKASFWIGVGFLLMLPLFYIDFSDTQYPGLQKAERVDDMMGGNSPMRWESDYLELIVNFWGNYGERLAS